MTQEQAIANLLEKINGKLDRIMAHWGVPPEEIEAKLRGVLPMELQTPTLRYDVLVRAVKKGLIEIEPYGLKWHGKRTSQLAYMCGRLWGGDYVTKDKADGKRYLKAGNLPFLGTVLDDIFGVKNLKQTRNQLFYQNLNASYSAVDYLFECHQ